MFYLDKFYEKALKLKIELVYTEKGLVYLGIDEFAPPSFVPAKKSLIPCAYPRFRKAWHEYFAGEEREFNFPLDLRTTDFKFKVYQQLLQIPYGQVRTYKDVAITLDNPNGQRAIGQAVGDNPLPLVIPCHRVIAKKGLGGYSLGLESKKHLLELEHNFLNKGNNSK